MIEVECGFNFHGTQIRVWKTVSEKEQTTWYTQAVLDEMDGPCELDFYIGVCGKSRGQVLLETGVRLQRYFESKRT